MQDTELLRLFKDVMDRQSDTFSNMTREIATLVEKQDSSITELKEHSNILKKIEFALNDGLHSKIKDDMYIVVGESRESIKSFWKLSIGKLYWKMVVAFSAGFVILVLVHIFGG